MADKYDLPRLRDAAATKFKENCNPQTNPQEFINAIYTVDNNTAQQDETLWKIILPKMQANISKLSESPAFVKLVTIDMPRLAVHLFKQLDPSAATFTVPPANLPTKPLKREAPGDLSDGEDDDYSGSDAENRLSTHASQLRAASRGGRGPRGMPRRGGEHIMGPGRRLG
jgi:hypothetical protein